MCDTPENCTYNIFCMSLNSSGAINVSRLTAVMNTTKLFNDC